MQDRSQPEYTDRPANPLYALLETFVSAPVQWPALLDLPGQRQLEETTAALLREARATLIDHRHTHPHDYDQMPWRVDPVDQVSTRMMRWTAEAAHDAGGVLLRAGIPDHTRHGYLLRDAVTALLVQHTVRFVCGARDVAYDEEPRGVHDRIKRAALWVGVETQPGPPQAWLVEEWMGEGASDGWRDRWYHDEEQTHDRVELPGWQDDPSRRLVAWHRTVQGRVPESVWLSHKAGTVPLLALSITPSGKPAGEPDAEAEWRTLTLPELCDRMIRAYA